MDTFRAFSAEQRHHCPKSVTMLPMVTDEDAATQFARNGYTILREPFPADLHEALIADAEKRIFAPPHPRAGATTSSPSGPPIPDRSSSSEAGNRRTLTTRGLITGSTRPQTHHG